jgi:phosphopantothenoylcysteine decarboxylase/phosphopantothenate--cysteine ligase
LNTEGAGFASDTNIVTLIMEEGLVELPCMSKEEVAATIFDVIVKK